MEIKGLKWPWKRKTKRCERCETERLTAVEFLDEIHANVAESALDLAKKRKVD